MRRRADSPHGPVTQESQHPAPKRARKSTSPLTPTESSTTTGARYMRSHPPSGTSPRVIRASSPSRPSLPSLHPLPQPATGGGGGGGGSSGGSGSGGGPSTYQSFSAAGTASSQPPPPGSWAPHWAPGHMSRHSIDAPHVIVKSASASPERRREAGGGGAAGGERDERRGATISGEHTTDTSSAPSSGPDIVFTRDVTNRQPRSMMACMRCRRQKMKCDGPGKEPCRGCRQAGVPCVFESRARPKSISTLPSRTSPFFAGSLPPGRGGTPSTGGPSFYPVSSQPAPPITSRPALIPDYVPRPGRDPREPMPPPPPNASISSLAGVGVAGGGGGAPYPPPLRAHSPPLHTPPSASQPGYYGPPPVQSQPPYPPGPMSQSVPPPPPPTGPPVMDSRLDGRLRSLESGLRNVSSLPAAVAGLQETLGSILRSQEHLASQIGSSGSRSAGGAAARTANDVPDHVWESYRVGAWPLTPWLPGISPLPGLPTLTLACLGRRAAVDRNETTRRDADVAADNVITEVNRLLSSRMPWTRDEVLSLGVFATWTSDPALGCLATGLARELQLDRPLTLRKSHNEWREWIYVVLADHMLHLPDFNRPSVSEPLAYRWRELVQTSNPEDPATHDRDSKLLAWLELSELLMDVQDAQRSLRPLGGAPRSPAERRDSGSDRSDHARQASGPPAGDTQTDRDRMVTRDIWRRHVGRIEAWASNCGARHDPVLSLHYNYAILYAASPVWAANERLWNSLSQTHEGYQQLERGRDAAFAVLQALAAPEIGRTLAHSFPVCRPFFGLAIAHLVSLTATMHHTALIGVLPVVNALRNVVDSLAACAPYDIASRPPPGSPAIRSPTGGQPTSSSQADRRPASEGGQPRGGDPSRALPPSLILEMADTGAVIDVGKCEVVSAEPGRELWSRLLG